MSMGFWSRLPCSPPGDLPNPRIELRPLMSPALAGRFFTTSAAWEASTYTWGSIKMYTHSDKNQVLKPSDLNSGIHSWGSGLPGYIIKQIIFPLKVRTSRPQSFSKLLNYPCLPLLPMEKSYQALLLMYNHSTSSSSHILTKTTESHTMTIFS